MRWVEVHDRCEEILIKIKEFHEDTIFNKTFLSKNSSADTHIHIHIRKED